MRDKPLIGKGYTPPKNSTNVCIGYNKVPSDNLCIGKNAGLDITTESDQVRIGDFDRDEVSLDTFKDCYIFQNGRVVIKKDAINYDLD